MRMISDNIGYDGGYFFCRRCGKTGYSKLAQVRGHLAMCPGTAIRKGAIPTGYNQLPTVNNAALGNLPQIPVATGYNSVKAAPCPDCQPFPNYQHQQQQLTPVATGRYNQLDQRVARLENEYNHMLVSQNSVPTGGDWFGKNKGIIIMVGILLFAFLLMEQRKPCQLGEANGKGKGMTGIGEKAIAKLVDRGISKSVDSLFR